LWALLVAGLAGVAVVILAVLAGRYQPVSVSFQDQLREAFAGIPTGSGIRYVNTLAGIHEDIYIPPQRGVFALSGIIVNNGTHPVTVVSASFDQGSGLTLAGPVRYSVPGMGGSPVMPPPTSKVLHNVVLAPRQEMFIGFPAQMQWPCVQVNGAFWSVIPNFTVTTRYLIFTHTVAVPWGMNGDNLILRLPAWYPLPGQKGVICAPGTTRANLPTHPLG
jgi:hypothetical protein